MYPVFPWNFNSLLSLKGEYPASSTSASEAANERTLRNRGPVFIMVTNLPLSFGTPLAVIIFLIVFSACHQSHFSTVWVCPTLSALLSIIQLLNMRLTFHVACLFWHWLHFSSICFLLQTKNAEQRALPSGCYQAKSPLSLSFSILLALFDWYLRRLVSL